MPRVKAESAADASSVDGNGATTPNRKDNPMYTATTTTTRRNANGSVSSVYSGNKIRHLKKDDGVPLWRKDIQYDFLRAVFDDDKRVFHKKSDGTFGHTFADIYLDAMAKSSKCSKILKDKLLSERPAALNMAMVCLLVNVGRMNTTLNFFPEMRAQLRTYHSIPSLQAHQDPNAYKQLQDAPRLKSILKGATEDVEQPSTLEDIRAARIPRTNPVNLIFVLAQYAPRISEMHFDVPRDFFDLVMKSTLSSTSRARSFLWLMWWYLESDFSDESALNNPYGEGRRTNPGEAPIKCPQFDYLSEEQAELENVDTPDEIEFGDLKKQERIAILKTDMAPVITGPKRSGKRITHYIVNRLSDATPGSEYNGGTSQFQVASEDGISSPTRDPNSPAPPPPPRGGYRSKPLQGTTFINKTTGYGSDSDRTRSASPQPQASHMTTFASKPSAMRIDAVLADTPTQPTPTQPPAKPKGPGRGNWRRNPAGNHHTPRSFAAKLELDTASQASSVGPAGALGPHGFYLPLNGADPVQKRSRPPTSHQIAVEKYRRDRVEHILDRGWRRTLPASGRKRVKEGAISRAWKRCKAVPAAYDSEEEANAIIRQAQAQASSASSAQQQVLQASVLEAADSLLLLAGLKRVAFEKEDWGEESLGVAKGLRRAKRRADRWERGEAVVNKVREKKTKADVVAESFEGEGENEVDTPEPSGGPGRRRGRGAGMGRVSALLNDERGEIPSSPLAEENGDEDDDDNGDGDMDVDVDVDGDENDNDNGGEDGGDDGDGDDGGDDGGDGDGDGEGKDDDRIDDEDDEDDEGEDETMLEA